MTNELLDLFDEAKRIIDKQEQLIKMQQSLIKTMQQGLQGVELNELLLKKQLADLQEELEIITKDYIDVMAPKILQACLSTKTGIQHIYSKKRTLYEIATYRGDNIEKISMDDLKSSVPRPIDTSLK